MRYVSLSGGADSTACAILWHEAGYEFEMVFADTGAELPETYWMIPRIAAALGRKLHVVCGGTFYQHLVNYVFLLPSIGARWCTRALKMAPLEKFFQPDDIVAVGLRADEPHRVERARSKPGPYQQEYPLYDAGMDKKAVKALCNKYGLLNPAYEWRTNVSCFCCPFQRKYDWKNLREYHPDLFALAEEWENISVEFAIAKNLTPYRWNQGYRLEQLREADENQLSLLPECSEEACLICR